MAEGSAYQVAHLTGPEKTRLLQELGFSGSLEPLIRSTAVNLCVGLHRDQHRERIERLHEFVRNSVPYHREPIEMFHGATATLLDGGDCDDHTILLAALAWALRYPWRVQVHGDPEDPRHYSLQIGYPASDSPDGDPDTVWRHYETIVDALPGEDVYTALRRIGT